MPDLFSEDEMTGDGMTYMDVEEEAMVTRADYEAAARQRLSTKEGRIEAITQRAYSRRFGSGNSNYIRECADDEYELLGFLAAAEQRATESEERAERLAAALEETHQYLIWLRKPVDLPDSRWPFTCAEADLDEKIRAALTAPATQPDERAAAARAIKVAALRVLTSWDQEDEPDIVDAFEALRDALGDPDTSRRDGLASLDATDGAAKETTT